MQCTRWKVERRKNNEMEKHYYRKLIDQSTVETCKDRNQKELHCTRRKVERGNLIYPCYLFAVSAKTKWTTAKTCKNRNHKDLQCTRRKVERGKLIYPAICSQCHLKLSELQLKPVKTETIKNCSVQGGR